MPSIRWGLGTGADLCLPFTGNATLSGCRLIGAGSEDDDVALAWNEHVADAGVIAHVVGVEGTGNALDSISDHHITPASWAGGEGWVGAHAIAGSWGKASTGTVPQVPVNADFTVEFWWHKTTPSPTDARSYMYIGAQDFSRISIEDYRQLAPDNWRFSRSLRAANPPGTYVRSVSGGNTFVAGWQHWGIERSGNEMRTYINGSVVGTVVDVSEVSVTGVQDRWLSSDGSALGWMWNDIYVTSQALHGGAAFSPVRYRSATQNGGVQPYAQASYAGLAGMVPGAVSWSATTGAGYGQVRRVWVNDLSAGWVQVGGDYPTSPVSVSGLVLPSADAVRVELEPEQVSGIQNETPVLNWVQLEYTAPATGGRVYRPTPLRFGPKLLPIGVL